MLLLLNIRDCGVDFMNFFVVAFSTGTGVFAGTTAVVVILTSFEHRLYVFRVGPKAVYG